MYVPADFDFRATPGFLKTLRFTRDETGGKMEIQPFADLSDGTLTGWNLQDEDFQPAGGGGRDTSRVLIKGQWNFIAFSAYLTDVTSEVRKRLWINDELTYEQIGETNGTLTARWYNNGWQTDNHPSTTFRTLNSATDAVNGMMVFTYWNGGIPTTATSPWPSNRGTYPVQDQALNIDSVVVHTNEADLGTDASGNKYIASTDVFPTNSTVDQVAPTLSSPTGTKTGTTTATGTVTTNEGNGTLYWLVDTSPTTVQATVLSTGATQAVSSTGEKVVYATGLPTSTLQYFHFVHKDAAGNDSAVTHSGSFTTDAAAPVDNNESSNTLYEALLPSIIPMVPACSDTLIENSIRSAVVELCEKSEVYQTEQIIASTSGVYDYTLTAPADTAIEKILSIQYNGVDLEPITPALLDQRLPKWRTEPGEPQYYVKTSSSTVRIAPAPSTGATDALLLRLILKPTHTSTSCDDDVMNDYRDTIINGALFRLLRLPSKDWTDYSAASVYGSLFTEQLVDAERRARSADTGVARKVNYGGIKSRRYRRGYRSIR